MFDGLRTFLDTSIICVYILQSIFCLERYLVHESRLLIHDQTAIAGRLFGTRYVRGLMCPPSSNNRPLGIFNSNDVHQLLKFKYLIYCETETYGRPRIVIGA